MLVTRPTSQFVPEVVMDASWATAKTAYPHYAEVKTGLQATIREINFLVLGVDPNQNKPQRFRQVGGLLNTLEALQEKLTRDEEQVDAQTIRSPDLNQQKAEIVALQAEVANAINAASAIEDTFRPEPSFCEMVTDTAKKYWYVTAPVLGTTYEVARHYALAPALSYAGRSLFNLGCKVVTMNEFWATCGTAAAANATGGTYGSYSNR